MTKVVVFMTMLQQDGIAGATAALSSSTGGSESYNNIKLRLESKLQQLSDRLRTLENQQQLVVRSHSAPSNATTTLPMPSLPTGLSLNKRESASSTSLLPSSLAPTATSGEDISGMAMQKIELCFRKAETYEGIAMVLNVSLDRLLTQVTEIDNQRRRESESREAQERKIQVSASVVTRQMVGQAEGWN